MRSKYGCGNDLMPKVTTKCDALNLWRGICNVWNHMEENLSWRLCNGNYIRFWLGKWVPYEGPLIAYVNEDTPEVDVDCYVSSFILPSGQWDS